MIGLLLLLVAPLWVGAYIVAGWFGVAVMAIAGVVFEAGTLALDELQVRRQRAIVLRRWDRMRGEDLRARLLERARRG